MSRRTNIIQQQIYELIGDLKIFREQRNNLRDNYEALLEAAQNLVNEVVAERDERLVRLNELRALEELPPLTLQDIRQEDPA